MTHTKEFCEKCQKIVQAEVVTHGEHYMINCSECDHLIDED